MFGARVAEDLRREIPAGPVAVRTAGLRIAAGSERGREEDAELTARVRRIMWEKVGLVRDEAGLLAALRELDGLARMHPDATGEARNLLGIARLVTAAALERHESRGGHFRADVPAPDPLWQRRLFLTAAPDGTACFEAPEALPARALATGGQV